MEFEAQVNRVPKWWQWAQVALAYGAIEMSLWSEGSTQKIWYVVSLLVIVVLTLVNRPDPRQIGFRITGARGSIWVVVAAALTAASVLVTAWALGTLKPIYGSKSPALHAFFYLVWAFEQQFILNAFFFWRIRAAIGDNWKAVALTATLFSAAHIPNPILVPATLLGGLFFIEAFRRWRTLYPLAVAHGMLGLALALSFPDSVMRHMRVGISFLRFVAHS
ncbi:MAG TPA: CPBP family intramembrane glutamic endopeptidase [Terriglobales bacterium]|nr:CPBP family intramembrane glutamic endopeptidase [Terriglobales bacterium]